MSYAPSARLLAEVTAEPADVSRSLVVGDPHGDLWHARQEATIVARVCGAQLLMEASASRKAVLTRLPDATHVHFACHGISAVDPMKSRLALAGRDFITLDELMHGQLLRNAKVVVASACHTAEKRLSGAWNETIGLAAGFLRAGASVSVGALWAVDDRSTAVLMSRFYEHLLSGQSVASALRAAQRWLRDSTAEELKAVPEHTGFLSRWLAFIEPDDRPFTHPYYWAAFVVLGE